VNRGDLAVSLFGLNSLDDVKSSLFENMEWLDEDGTSFTQRGGRQGPKPSLLVQRNFLNWLERCPEWVSCSRRPALFTSRSFRTRSCVLTILTAGPRPWT
jgi:hypothetical protein